jgi:hypothetical protein
MTLPDSVATATVEATFLDASGSPRSGTVSFRPTTRVAVGDTGITIDPVTARLTDGRFSVTLAATDDTDLQPTGWGYSIVVDVDRTRYAFTAFAPATGSPHNLFELTPVSPVDPLLINVKSVNDILPDEDGNVDLGAISAPVTSVAGRIGAVVLTKTDVGLPLVDNTSDAGKPLSTATVTALAGKSNTGHTHLIADVSSLQTALDAKEATGVAAGLDAAHVAAGNPHPIYLTQAEADALYATLATAAGKATKPIVRQAYITTGNVNPLPNTAAAWAALAGFEIQIPAVVGDYVDLSLVAMRHVGGGAANVMLDAAVRVGSSNVRYLSTGSATPPTEGDPGWYSATNIVGRAGARGFTVVSGDLDAGNVRFVVAVKANGTGILYASTDYPFYWRATNFGPVN